MSNNAILFIIQMMKGFAELLSEYSLYSVPIWTWFVGFIFVGMVVSVFWRGARG